MARLVPHSRARLAARPPAHPPHLSLPAGQPSVSSTLLSRPQPFGCTPAARSARSMPAPPAAPPRAYRSRPCRLLPPCVRARAKRAPILWQVRKPLHRLGTLPDEELSEFSFTPSLFPTTHPPVPSTLKLNTARPTPHPIRIALFQTMGNVPRNGRGTRPLAAARPPSASPPRRLCPPGTLAERPWAWCELT